VYVVGLAVKDEYDRLGGQSVVGAPISHQICGLAKSGCYQRFEKGDIYWSESSGSQLVKGSIRWRWLELGADKSSIGYPIGAELATENGGWQQQYQNGYIVGSYSTGYWESKGSIRTYW